MMPNCGIGLPVIFNEINTVVVVKIRGEMTVTSNKPRLKEGSILLPADFADIYNPGYGEHAVLKGSGSNSIIANWVDARARLEWVFDAEPGNYRVEALVWSAEKGGVTVSLGDQKINAEIPDTGEDYELVKLGEVEIMGSGEQAISLLPAAENNSDKQLMYLELIKL